jgi:hypothetical protein
MDVVDKYSISPSVNYALTEGEGQHDNQEEKEATRADEEPTEPEEISRSAKRTAIK